MLQPPHGWILFVCVGLVYIPVCGLFVEYRKWLDISSTPSGSRWSNQPAPAATCDLVWAIRAADGVFCCFLAGHSAEMWNMHLIFQGAKKAGDGARGWQVRGRGFYIASQMTISERMVQ